MKTFQQFQADIQENVASMALKGARNILPAAAAALGAAGTIFQARQSKPQMSPDYGQGGETAKPRTPNVQRPSGKVTAAETQRRQAAADRKADAQARARATGATGQGELGQRAQQVLDQQRQLAKDAEYARQRRENPALRDAEAKQRRIDARRAEQRARMDAAANKLGLPEQMTAPKLMTRGLDLRSTKDKQKEIKIEADLLPYNPAIGDRYKTQ